MRTGTVVTLLILGALAWGQEEPTTLGTIEQSKAQRSTHQRQSSARPYVGKEDFFHFATKQLNPNDTDWGAWIERRRQVSMEAMVENPFFWYSALATGLLIVLMVAYGVRVMGEKRKLWHAAEILTVVWNQEQYSQSVAQTETERYSRHVLDCNRVIEAQVSGRPSPEMFEANDAREQLERLRPSATTSIATTGD
jgi:hypothetical protein